MKSFPIRSKVLMLLAMTLPMWRKRKRKRKRNDMMTFDISVLLSPISGTVDEISGNRVKYKLTVPLLICEIVHSLKIHPTFFFSYTVRFISLNPVFLDLCCLIIDYSLSRDFFLRASITVRVSIQRRHGT